jgi:hypothetical protein
MAPESEPTPTPDPDDTMTTFSANEICPSKFNNEPVTFVLPPYNLSDDDIARLLPAGNSLEETCELANWKCTNFGGNTMVTTYSNMLDENQINLLPRTVEEGTSFNTVENAILIIHQSTDSE